MREKTHRHTESQRQRDKEEREKTNVTLCKQIMNPGRVHYVLCIIFCKFKFKVYFLIKSLKCCDLSK